MVQPDSKQNKKAIFWVGSGALKTKDLEYVSGRHESSKLALKKDIHWFCDSEL